jgi:hypothetical protein
MSSGPTREIQGRRQMFILGALFFPKNVGERAGIFPDKFLGKHG